MRLKRGLMNIIAGIGSQLLILAFGMIVPRMMILTYGSEVNGFFSSISQLLSYYIHYIYLQFLMCFLMLKL